MTPSNPASTIAVIGGGPRAVAVIERLAAALRGAEVRGEIHVIDDAQPGAGRLWRAEQPRELCMNTLAHAVTLFTDPSVTMAGQVVVGPTLHEWSLLVADRSEAAPASIGAESVALLAAVPPRAGLAEEYADELGVQVPQSHPSRALFGEYVSWCWAVARTALPSGVTVVEHTARAVAVEPVDGRQSVRFADGGGVDADLVVMVPGWLPPRPGAAERALDDAVRADPGLVRIRPDSPADQPFHLVPDGADAIVRGLGMGFFDAMALLTIGRGGEFVEESDGALRYRPSGREPVLHVTSHRGQPYRAKSIYGGLPPTAAQRRLRAAPWLGLDRPVDFDAEAWPLILKDALEAFVDVAEPDLLLVDAATARTAIDAAPDLAGAVLDLITGLLAESAERDALVEALASAVVDGTSDDMVGFVERDLHSAALGSASPVKAALWSISSARSVCARAGAFGRFSPATAARYRTLHAIGGMAGSGPPAFRSRQLAALARAGLVRFLGGGIAVGVDAGGFVATDAAGRERARARVLIDAFVRAHDADDSDDPLIAQLVSSGRMRSFRLGDDRSIGTGGVDVERGTWRVVRADGTADPTLWLAGIPLEPTIGDTIISPMPGADSTMLRECDAIAVQLAAALRGEART